ncbi:MAG TPA: HAD-IIIC family phosphatase [Polyangiaceae bacterium]|nr:HAD-IIIC family phosphatase [Polyangiaceae bacterium]
MRNEGRIEIGRRATLRSLGSPVRLVATSTGAISLGDGVLIDVGSHIFSARSVRIGDRSTIGPNVVISDRDENGVVGPIVIEDGVRLGVGVRVMGPCRIGRDATVLAGSVIRTDVPARSVVGESQPSGRSDALPAKPKPAQGRELNGAAKSVSEKAPVRRVRAVLAADSTINSLADYLSGPTEDGLLVDSEVAPFDQVVPTLIALLARDPKPDLAVVWTLPERACPSFQDLLFGGSPSVDQMLTEVDAFASLLATHASVARFVFVPSWVMPPWRRGMGMLELRGPRASAVLMRMNLRLADAIAQIPNVFLLDAQRWLSAAGDGGFEPKLWYAGKIAFTTDVLYEAACDMQASLRGLFGMSRKLVVVDLDDTLWGGIVGDVGWENLQLGGHDPNGEAFVQFQKQLLALTKRGIALAVVSKNEEATALQAMRSHPEMIIRPEMLAAFRINWLDKAQNIADIARELNLGIQSVVFLDDNPLERGRVREALPEVYVPEWPVDPTHYPRALESLRCFDAPHISHEDLERNAMYATERERNSLRTQVGSLDEWLATLGLKVRFEPVGPPNVARAAQLLNKTNQLNLRTRRLSEVELLEWSRTPGREMWAVHVSDRFGNAGLTGLLGLAKDGQDVHMTDFVLSCRVMGRRVEETMVWAGSRRADQLGGKRLLIAPIPTAKNKPCIDFFARLEGLIPGADGYVRSVSALESAPGLVAVDGLP